MSNLIDLPSKDFPMSDRLTEIDHDFVKLLAKISIGQPLLLTKDAYLATGYDETEAMILKKASVFFRQMYRVSMVALPGQSDDIMSDTEVKWSARAPLIPGSKCELLMYRGRHPFTNAIAVSTSIAFRGNVAEYTRITGVTNPLLVDPYLGNKNVPKG
jgi:hypothetical protein